MDWEQLAEEAALWPWLDSDCMADPCEPLDCEPFPLDCEEEP